jgi:hypothetical protein
MTHRGCEGISLSIASNLGKNQTSGDAMQPEAIVACNDSQIAGALERAIRKRTCDRVTNLQVEWRCELVVVSGSTRTYYVKQLALEAAREALGIARPLRIEIDVI